jgi:hypothetical protein
VRSLYVLGTAKKPLKLAAPKKKRGENGQGRSMLEWLEAGQGETEEIAEGERDIEAEWEGGLDGLVGWEEWRSLAAVHERALMWLPNVRLPALHPRSVILKRYMCADAAYLALVPLPLHAPFVPRPSLALPRSTHVRPRSPLPPWISPHPYLASLPHVGLQHGWRDNRQGLAQVSRSEFPILDRTFARN